MTLFNKIKLGLVLSLLAAIIIFLAQNNFHLEVKFLFFDLLSVNLLLLISLFTLLGIILGVFGTFYFLRKDEKNNLPNHF
tara:strand:- start:1053 stop:1292 length:240 start_codon:yes stop_codon:yes gene_type:complete